MGEENKIISLAGARESKEKDKNTEESTSSEQKEPIYCSFCGRPNYMVIKMIEGPGVNICSECTMICVQYFMLSDQAPSEDVKKILDSFWTTLKKK